MSQFAPGKSGNPGGRPKEKGTVVADLKVMARAKTVDAFNAIIEVMEDPSAKPGIRLKAAEMVLDRAWGKAAPAVEASPEGEKVTVQLVTLTPEEADKIRKATNNEAT